MKRLAFLGLLVASTAFLTGCPIWDDRNDNQCFDGCGTGGGPGTSASSGGDGCFAQIECAGPNETCGSDHACHVGDCTFWGCGGPNEVCRVGDDMQAHCVESQGAGGSGGVSTGGGPATGGGGAGGAPTTGSGGTGGAGGAPTTTGAGAGGTGGATTTTGAGAGGTGGATTTTGAGAGGAGGASTGTGTGGAGAGMP